MTVYFFIILFVVVLDQLTKFWSMDLIASANGILVSELYEGATKPIIDGFLNFTFIKNDGMAFGLLGEHRWVFMSLSVIGIAAMFGYLVYMRGGDKLMSFSLALVVGGGIGNMFDRIALEYVVDFIDVRCFSFWKWIFNVADSAVCVGAALIILSVILDSIKEGKKK